MTREILCFGDSNTWGFDPRDKNRYPWNVRWTGLLQQRLGPGFHVIEEGQNGRTTVWDDPVEGHKNGLAYLPPCLETHKPLDLVLIMLGTNDLKHRFSLPAYDIARSAGRLVDTVRQSGSGRDAAAPEVLLVCPPVLARLSEFADMFEGGAAKSRDLARHYAQRAELHKAHFLDAGSVVRTSDIDGVHWAPEQHAAFAEALEGRIREILEQG